MQHHDDRPWGTAARATVHCLTGCAIGEVLGLVIGTALAWSTAPTMTLAIALAFLFGYSLTMYAVLRAGVPSAARPRWPWPPTRCPSP
jgi:hypothetical protein